MVRMLREDGSTPTPGSGPHLVRFYETDDALAHIIADFVSDGLAAREAVLVIATAAHRAQVKALLDQRDAAIDEALIAGRLLLLDADETLARFMDGSSPSWERFYATVNGILDAATGGAPGVTVRAYGEMVDVLWRAGHAEAALQVEEMWNAVQRDRAFTLLCAYVVDSFQRDAAGLRRVSELHTHAHTHGDGGSASARAILADARRNHRLQQVTAAIAAAVTRDEVLETVVDKLARTLGASSVGLFLVGEDRKHVLLARQVGYTDDGARALARTPLDGARALPVTDSIRRGEPVWIDDQAALLARYPHLASVVSPDRRYRIACMPLVAHGQTIGGLGLTFDDAPPMDLDERAFLQLVARYSALALERVRLQDEERTSRERAELLYGLARAVIAARTVEEVFDAALDAITLALRTPRGEILTYGHDPVMHFRAWRGLSEGYRAAVDGHSPWSRETRDAEPIVVTDVAADPAMARFQALFRDEQIGALAFIPLCAGTTLLGKFMLYYGAPRELRPAELDLARAIADHVAAALSRFAAVAELEETVRFNEVFTGVLGHDLRNPLGAIVTAAQLAMVKNPSEKLNKPLSRILTSSARMSRMIDQLLDFTHVRLGGGVPLHCQHLDLVPIVRHVVDELDDAHPEWTLSLDVGGDTTGAWDGDRLAQLFSNLVANALQHGEVAGGVRVRLDGSRPDHLRAEIENAGAIAPELLPVLFEPLAGGAIAQGRRPRPRPRALHLARDRAGPRRDDRRGVRRRVTDDLRDRAAAGSLSSRVAVGDEIEERVAVADLARVPPRRVDLGVGPA
ncbi:MAG: GAF domain-containing protein, partial [Kofleriaceae bacterium]